MKQPDARYINNPDPRVRLYSRRYLTFTVFGKEKFGWVLAYHSKIWASQPQ